MAHTVSAVEGVWPAQMSPPGNGAGRSLRRGRIQVTRVFADDRGEESVQ
jgi:hypothetical protein